MALGPESLPCRFFIIPHRRWLDREGAAGRHIQDGAELIGIRHIVFENRAKAVAAVEILFENRRIHIHCPVLLIVDAVLQNGVLLINPERFQRRLRIGGFLQHTPGHGMILVDIHEFLGDVQVGGYSGTHQERHGGKRQAAEQPILPNPDERYPEHSNNHPHRGILLLRGRQNDAAEDEQAEQGIIVVSFAVEQQPGGEDEDHHDHDDTFTVKGVEIRSISRISEHKNSKNGNNHALLA
ncbi:hypothetical protein D3C75_664080 [compost metagenome]